MHLPPYLAPFQPRLSSALKGYTKDRFFKDAGAGFTVGIVALGSLFFGAVAKVDPILTLIESAPSGMVIRLDVQSLQSLDTSGLDVLEQLRKAIVLRGGKLVIAGLNAQPKAVMERSGFLSRVESAA